MAVKISPASAPQDWELVTPNFIYNRFDLFCKQGEFQGVKIRSGGETKVVEYRISGEELELGLWLTPISQEELENLLYHLTKTHPEVKKIIYKNGVLPYGKAKAHNHFRIVFPETADEMRKRISPKQWSEMRRRNRRAEEKYGKMQILEYDRKDIPENVVEAFFKYKLETWNRSYHMTPEEYLDKYHVSGCYVIMFGDTLGAVNFVCEQCPVANGENNAYNPELKEFSLGKFLYIHGLVRMTEKKHTELFLSGGNFEYKKHYGSIEETLYDCEISVSDLDIAKWTAQHSPWGRCKAFLKTHLPPKTVEWMWKVKHRICKH